MSCKAAFALPDEQGDCDPRPKRGRVGHALAMPRSSTQARKIEALLGCAGTHTHSKSSLRNDESRFPGAAARMLRATAPAPQRDSRVSALTGAVVAFGAARRAKYCGAPYVLAMQEPLRVGETCGSQTVAQCGCEQCGQTPHGLQKARCAQKETIGKRGRLPHSGHAAVKYRAQKSAALRWVGLCCGYDATRRGRAAMRCGAGRLGRRCGAAAQRSKRIQYAIAVGLPPRASRACPPVRCLAPLSRPRRAAAPPRQPICTANSVVFPAFLRLYVSHRFRTKLYYPFAVPWSQLAPAEKQTEQASDRLVHIVGLAAIQTASCTYNALVEGQSLKNFFCAGFRRPIALLRNRMLQWRVMC
eukprot:1221922-Pleurochrysis_carterae.AAC.2